MASNVVVAVRVVTVAMEITLLHYRLMISWSWDCDWGNICGGSSPVSPSEWKVSPTAGEDISASSNHIIGKSKLLTIENEGISILPEAIITVSALFLQPLESVPLVINLSIVVIDAVIVAVNVVIVFVDFVVVLVDAVFKVINFVVQIDHSFTSSFKGDHQLCFSLNPLFVLNLVPDWIPFVEVADLVPEVTGGNITIGLRSIVLDLVA